MASFTQLLQECDVYINTLSKGKAGCVLIRGTYDNCDIQLFNHSLEKRTPRNMDESVHDAINRHFVNIFKWPVRNGVFCFGATNPSMEMPQLGYGRVHLMFPCGNFEYVCDSEIFDLYVHYYQFCTIKPKATLSEFIGTINYSNCDLIQDMSKLSNYGRSAEIMIKCEQYYLVSLNYLDKLIKLVWG